MHPLRPGVISCLLCSIYSLLHTEPQAARIAMQEFARDTRWRPRPPPRLYEELLSTLVSAADMMRCPRRKVWWIVHPMVTFVPPKELRPSSRHAEKQCLQLPRLWGWKRFLSLSRSRRVGMSISEHRKWRRF